MAEPYLNRRAAIRANHEARLRKSREIDRRIVDLYPLMSVRDIAKELETLTAQAVLARAVNLGLPPRPIGARP